MSLFLVLLLMLLLLLAFVDFSLYASVILTLRSTSSLFSRGRVVNDVTMATCETSSTLLLPPSPRPPPCNPLFCSVNILK